MTNSSAGDRLRRLAKDVESRSFGLDGEVGCSKVAVSVEFQLSDYFLAKASDEEIRASIASNAASFWVSCADSMRGKARLAKARGTEHGRPVEPIPPPRGTYVMFDSPAQAGQGCDGLYDVDETIPGLAQVL